MTHGSLFAGIGGFDLGFQWAGIETVWQVEIDDYCRQVLARHFPEAERFSDIRDCGAHNLKPVDIISGGFPCQPFSHAGKRRGTEDDRYLWPEMLRVIAEIRPTWVVGENVSGIISMAEQIGDLKMVSKDIQRLADSDHYKGIFTRQEVLLIGFIIKDLQEIGYELPRLEDGTPIVWCVPAAGVDAPHLRKRIWIVAYAQGQRRGETREHSDRSPERFTECGKIVAYPPTIRREGDGSVAARQHPRQEQARPHTEQGCQDVADASGAGRRKDGAGEPRRQEGITSDSICINDDNGGYGTGQESGKRPLQAQISGSEYWLVEPDVGRVAHGIPSRVDRLKGLGNAIVPQIAEIIGRRLMEIEA